MALPTDIPGCLYDRPTILYSGPPVLDIQYPGHASNTPLPDPTALRPSAVLEGSSVRVYFGRAVKSTSTITTASRYTFSVPSGAPALSTTTVTLGEDSVLLGIAGQLRPGTYTLHIDAFTAEGTDDAPQAAADLSFQGADRSAPIIQNMSPPAGTTIDPFAPLTFEVVDQEGALGMVVVLVAVGSAYEAAFDGDAFGPGYTQAPNGRTPISGGWRFTLLRSGGWPAAAQGVRLKVHAVDASGQLLG